ncbi:MAG: isopentenyl-diphosphate delta-isomerase [Prolixibacteraceae bacterium]|jgi:isopentenyl-diphosphate delta-isomerase|nr:isopentenyl-diphosphate delta-isomerase [Prolixibacteraceae bacterium]
MKTALQEEKIKQFVDRDRLDRKSDHINLAIQSQTAINELDSRFYYEPMISAFPKGEPDPIPFAGKIMKVPIWVSSMTGGNALSGTINRNLAMACNEFGLGMGLGSCRMLLNDSTLFNDFNMRPIIGDKYPLFANLGIAQVEEILAKKETDQLRRLVDRLKADGLIIHVNPLQEWIQPEGNVIRNPPVETIEKLLNVTDFQVIVKEVGQGFGPESIHRLMELPLTAIEFGAFGGTNFSKVENSRTSSALTKKYLPFVNVGVTANEMVDIINEMVLKGYQFTCNQLIISGGIRNYLDGYYLVQKSIVPAIYAQASLFLTYSRGHYSALQQFISDQIEGYKMAMSFLTLRPQNKNTSL